MKGFEEEEEGMGRVKNSGKNLTELPCVYDACVTGGPGIGCIYRTLILKRKRVNCKLIVMGSVEGGDGNGGMLETKF